jgi:hypothetical protein
MLPFLKTPTFVVTVSSVVFSSDNHWQFGVKSASLHLKLLKSGISPSSMGLYSVEQTARDFFPETDGADSWTS